MTAVEANPSPTISPDERLLVSRAKRGDVSAFEQLVRVHHSRVFAVALGITRDRTDAEDVTQDAFVRAWRALPAFRADAALGTWLYRIATNVALNLVTRRPDRAAGDVPEVPDRTDQPEARTLGRERIDVVAAALDDLTPTQRATYVLRDVEGLAYEEIAEVLDTTVSAVKSRLFRARQHIAAAMLAYDHSTTAPADAGPHGEEER